MIRQVNKNMDVAQYRVSRKAPGELVQHFPHLWLRLSTQRFAWLQLPWLFFFLIALTLSYWPAAIAFLVIWIWQRKTPFLLVCNLVEWFIYLYFLLLVLAVISMVSMIEAGPFVPIFLVLVIVLLYEASARGWHYLFNYMSLLSNEFSEYALSNKWIDEKITVRKRTSRPLWLALTGILLATVGMMIAGRVEWF